jgi:type II secretory pathway component PulF
MRKNIFYIIAALIAFVIGIRLLMTNKKVLMVVHRMSLDIPAFGPLVKNSQITRLSQVLSTLLSAGVDVTRALDITAASVSNLVYRRELLATAQELRRQGVNIADCLSKTPNIFPPVVVQMIRIGEKTGKLDESFRYIADFFSKEIDGTVSNMTSIIEPVLLMVMGIIVGFVAISVITPIYKLTEGIHR